MFILKKGHQPGVYVPLGALFLVLAAKDHFLRFYSVTLKILPDFVQVFTTP